MTLNPKPQCQSKLCIKKVDPSKLGLFPETSRNSRILGLPERKGYNLYMRLETEGKDIGKLSDIQIPLSILCREFEIF